MSDERPTFREAFREERASVRTSVHEAGGRAASMAVGAILVGMPAFVGYGIGAALFGMSFRLVILTAIGYVAVPPWASYIGYPAYEAGRRVGWWR